MSEHQYYEFRAVDRPLDKKQMGELRDLSTRAEITPTSFVNVYNYGDFRGDPKRLMEKYFDAFVYSANWGTRQVMLRVPRRMIDAEAMQPYCDGESASLHLTADHAVFDFSSQHEPEGWQDDDDEWLSSMLPLRDEIIAGDLRCLYLGWLIGVQGDEQSYLEDDEPEPPLPPGLRRLSPALKSFADFLRIDEDLIRVAAEQDRGTPPAGPSAQDLAQWIAALPGSEKDAWLLRLTGDEGPLLHREFLLRFRESQTGPGRVSTPAQGPAPRTAGELRAAWEARAEADRRKEEARRVAEEARRAREKAAARAKHLDALAKREAEAWKEVEPLIQTKLPKEYDRAVELLVDLRDLAEREGRADKAAARIQDLHERHARKPTFVQRLKKAGLLK